MFTETVVPEMYVDIPGIRCRSNNPLDNVDVTTEYFQEQRKQEEWEQSKKEWEERRRAVRRIKKLATGLDKMIEVDYLADVARQMNVWNNVAPEIDQANRRIRKSYKWCGMEKDGRRTLVIDGYAVKDNIHVRHLEIAGWERCEAGGR